MRSRAVAAAAAAVIVAGVVSATGAGAQAPTLPTPTTVRPTTTTTRVPAPDTSSPAPTPVPPPTDTPGVPDTGEPTPGAPPTTAAGDAGASGPRQAHRPVPMTAAGPTTLPPAPGMDLSGLAQLRNSARRNASVAEPPDPGFDTRLPFEPAELPLSDVELGAAEEKRRNVRSWSAIAGGLLAAVAGLGIQRGLRRVVRRPTSLRVVAGAARSA